MAELYKFEHVGKRFSGPENLEIFKDINISVEEGESLAIVGTSGSGKSTLLHLMGALDTPSSGKIFFDGRDMSEMKPDEKARFRNRTLGFVFQFHQLLPEFTLLENVAMPALIGGRRRSEAFAEAAKLIDYLGLSDRSSHRPAQLSGGEQQMLAMGRALMSKPKIILMDEPSMGLSPILVEEIFHIIRDISAGGTTVLLVEQNAKKALAIADRAYVLETGNIVLSGDAKEMMNNDSIKKAYLGE